MNGVTVKRAFGVKLDVTWQTHLTSSDGLRLPKKACEAESPIIVIVVVVGFVFIVVVLAL